MKQTKITCVHFSDFDRPGIEAYLEKQAQQGWMLDHISVFWRFRRIAPKKMKVSVVFFPKASEFDPKPLDSQMTFCEFCEHTGWHLATSAGRMQVFYNEAENPTPIETDPVLEVAAIHSVAKKMYLPNYYFWLFLWILNCGFFFFRLSVNPWIVLSNNADLFSGLLMTLVVLLVLIEVTRYHRWQHRALKIAEQEGRLLRTKHLFSMKIGIIFLMIVSVSLMVSAYSSAKALSVIFVVGSLLCAVALILLVYFCMKRLKTPAKYNRAVTILLTLVSSIVLGILWITNFLDFQAEEKPAQTYVYHGHTFKAYQDPLLLTIQDLADPGSDAYSYECKTQGESFILGYTQATQSPRWDALTLPGLSYKVVTVKLPVLYDCFKNLLLDDFAHNYGRPEPEEAGWEEHILIDSAPWLAQEALQLQIGGEPQMRFLLCYADRIVELSLEDDWLLTPEQMRLVGEKLGS